MKKSDFIIVIIIVILLSIIIPGFFKSNKLRVYFLDVGQGDSILIRSPDNKYLLVDSGPDNKVLSEIGRVMPFWERTIDSVIVTHADMDHIGGIPEVLSRYKVSDIYLEENEDGNSAYKETVRIIEKLGANRIEADEYSDFLLGCCVEIDFLYPYLDLEFEEVGDINDFSYTFELKYKNFNAFFAGDLGKEYEELVMKRNPIDVEVLKVGHHGSSTSTSKDFLKILDPELAVISVGGDNKYGHPTDEVLSNLSEYNVEIRRTDYDGMVRLVSDGYIYYIDNSLAGDFKYTK